MGDALKALGLGLMAAVALAAPAQANDNTYINALDAAELMDLDDDPYYCRGDGACWGQFESPAAALQTGRWVCEQVQAGKPRSVLVDWLSNGEGLMPSPHSAPIIVDAAVEHLCPQRSSGPVWMVQVGVSGGPYSTSWQVRLSGGALSPLPLLVGAAAIASADEADPPVAPLGVSAVPVATDRAVLSPVVFAAAHTSQ